VFLRLRVLLLLAVVVLVVLLLLAVVLASIVPVSPTMTPTVALLKALTTKTMPLACLRLGMRW
jgi:hypothetical protein